MEVEGRKPTVRQVMAVENLVENGGNKTKAKGMECPTCGKDSHFLAEGDTCLVCKAGTIELVRGTVS